MYGRYISSTLDLLWILNMSKLRLGDKEIDDDVTYGIMHGEWIGDLHLEPYVTRRCNKNLKIMLVSQKFSSSKVDSCGNENVEINL